MFFMEVVDFIHHFICLLVRFVAKGKLSLQKRFINRNLHSSVHLCPFFSPMRIPRISVLSAQGNNAFSSVLKLSERALQSQMHLQAVTARNGGSLPPGPTPVRPAPTAAAIKPRVNVTPMNRVGGGVANVATAPRPVPVPAAGTIAAAQLAQLKRLAAAAGLQNSGSAAPALKKPYMLSQNASSMGQTATGQSASAVKMPVVVLPPRVTTAPAGPLSTIPTSHENVPFVAPVQTVPSVVAGPSMAQVTSVYPVAAYGSTGPAGEQLVANNGTPAENGAPRNHDSSISPNV